MQNCWKLIKLNKGGDKVMNENLPQKYNRNFFSNLLLKIKLFFWGKSNNKNISLNSEKYGNNKDTKTIFLEQIKFKEEIKGTNYEKSKFMKNLEDTPSLLEKFSIDRLEVILQYYLEENKKKRKLLNSKID